MTIATSVLKVMALGLPAGLARLILGGNTNGDGISFGIGQNEFFYKSVQDTQTAHAGGGQAAGFPIAQMVTRFTVVATAGDSATLPTSATPGICCVVNNSSANSMNVFPDLGGQINALGANAAFALAAGKTAEFTASSVLQWVSNLTA